MFSTYLEKKILNVFFMGLSTGIPFLLTLTTLNLWLKEEGISNTTIGLFVVVTLPSTFRFFFGPIVDEIKIPILKYYFCQRRSWIILSQIMISIMLLGISYSNPAKNIIQVGIWAFGINFFASMKDVIIQAYRIEITDKNKEGFSASASNIGFRLGMLMGGGGALFIASSFTWKQTYQIFSFIIGLLLIQTLFCENSPFSPNKEKQIFIIKIFNNYKNTFLETLKNNNIVFIVFFILLYKCTDIFLASMLPLFLSDMNYSKIEMAYAYNFVGILSMIAGGIIGGSIINSKGISKSILWGSILKSISSLIFMLHAFFGKNIYILFFTIGFDKFVGMLTTSVLISYFSYLCKKEYASTQFSIFSSTGSISRIIITMLAGYLTDIFSWPLYFLFASFSSIPCFFFLKRSLHKNSNL